MLGYNCNGGCISKNNNWRRGDIVGCRRNEKNAYIHTFIYLGNDSIVEAVPNMVINGSIWGQLKDPNNDFCIVMNGMFGKAVRQWGDIPTNEEIACKAESVIGQHWPYDSSRHNCQHFISYILIDDKYAILPGIDTDQKPSETSPLSGVLNLPLFYERRLQFDVDILNYPTIKCRKRV